MKNENYMFVEDVPDWVAESINEILETTLTVNSLPLPRKLTNSVASVKVAVLVVLVLLFG